MKDTFVKALVVCAAISAFSGGAYTLGSTAKSAFENLLKSEIAALNGTMQSTTAPTVVEEPVPAVVTPSPKAKSKFGITFEQ